jgi:hypothetical protein
MLVLNRNWHPVGVASVARSLTLGGKAVNFFVAFVSQVVVSHGLNPMLQVVGWN